MKIEKNEPANFRFRLKSASLNLPRPFIDLSGPHSPVTRGQIMS